MITLRNGTRFRVRELMIPGVIAIYNRRCELCFGFNIIPITREEAARILKHSRKRKGPNTVYMFHDMKDPFRGEERVKEPLFMYKVTIKRHVFFFMELPTYEEMCEYLRKKNKPQLINSNSVEITKLELGD